MKSAQNNNRKSKKKRNKERETKAQQQEQINNQTQAATAPHKQQHQKQQDNGTAVTPKVPANSDSNSNKAGRKIHTWPNDTVLVTGDSIISGLRENKFDGPGKIKVGSFPEATILDTRDRIKPLMRK